jgi:hypothetical protein
MYHLATKTSIMGILTDFILQVELSAQTCNLNYY